jgi:hypothetical protein
MNSVETTTQPMNDVSNANNIEQSINNNPENILIDTVEHLYNYAKSIHTSKITPSNIVIITT